MTEPVYPRIKYQGVPRAPLQNLLQNPGYIYMKVDNPDAERSLGGDWHDTPGDAIASVPKDAKLTAEQYALVAAQATERGAIPQPAPKFDEASSTNDDKPAAASKPHAGGPSDPAAQIPEPAEKQRNEGEWPRESERRKR